MKKLLGLLVVLSVVLTATAALAAPKKPRSGGYFDGPPGAITEAIW